MDNEEYMIELLLKQKRTKEELFERIKELERRFYRHINEE